MNAHTTLYAKNNDVKVINFCIQDAIPDEDIKA